MPEDREIRGGGGRSPVVWVLDVLSSVKLGIALLTILFFYATIGSAGFIWREGGRWVHVMPRQWRAFELTEFGWFHTWFFIGLILLIALNITVTTVRRIPLNAIKLGAWIIHAGILIMIAGCLVYFGLKVEGSTIIGARKLVVSVEGGDGPAELVPVFKDNAVVTTPEGRYGFMVLGVNDRWPLLTPGREGETAYVIEVGIQSPDGSLVTRQVFRDEPGLDQDIVFSGGGAERAVTALGRRFADERVSIRVEPMPQREFWVRESSALYVRDVEQRAWSERPIEGLPRYNDSAKGDGPPLWPARGAEVAVRHGVDIGVPAGREPDVLAGADVRITGFLRYAVLDTQRSAAAEGPPAVVVRIVSPEGKLVDASLMDALGQELGPEAPLVYRALKEGETVDQAEQSLPGTRWRVMVVTGGAAGAQALVLNRTPSGVLMTHEARSNVPVLLDDGSALAVREVFEHSQEVTRPVIVPPEQRNADIDRMGLASMVRVAVRWPDGSGNSVWLPASQYVSDDALVERLDPMGVRPAFIEAPGGRTVELRFGPERRDLPATVVLDKFIVTEHEGGFTGAMQSIRDWTSEVTFEAGGGGKSRSGSIATNQPEHFGGYWFFQSGWDPPGDPVRSATGFGSNYERAYAHTVLGVGNRHGVRTMLAGATISVAGMMYAFYVKPVIRRKRLAAAMGRAGVEARGARASVNGDAHGVSALRGEGAEVRR